MTKGLVALVESKAAITALLGTTPTRFYPHKLPQGQTTFPSAAYRVVSTTPRHDFDGASEYDFHAVDIFCYGRTYSDAHGLYDTMRSELEDQAGTFNTVQIDYVWYAASGAEDWLDDLELYTKQLELRIATRR